MGSGASAVATPTLPWPDGAKAVLYPGAELPDGLSINGPSACNESGISYWQLGGPSKARLRITEDSRKLLQLGGQFTVAICCRAGPGGKSGGYDSLLLGDDNKHWLALKGGEGTVCYVEGSSGLASEVDGKVGENTWSQLFLRPGPGGGTSVLTVDEEGLLELGSLSASLAGSKLRNCGWADNQVEIAAIAVWDRTIPWSELSAAVTPSRPLPEPAPEVRPEGKVTSFRGQVVDLHGKPLTDVRVGWSNGGCVSDKDGCFAGEAEDTTWDEETTVPDDEASEGSDGSISWMSLSFECEGFSPMYSPASIGSDTSMRVTMRPISASATFDATAGGNVVDPTSGSSVTMPPNTLVYPDGSEVTGTVSMDLAIIDVTTAEGLSSMPGDFSAIGADGSEVMLQSLGAAWVGATDEAGRKLQVKSGSKYTLDLQTEATANAAKIDTLPEMWSFDEATGKWQLEPSEMKINGEAAPNKARPAGSPAVSSTPAVAPSPIKSKKKGRAKPMGKGWRKTEYDPEDSGVVTGCMSPEAFMQQVEADGKKSVAAEVTKLGYINCDLAYHHPQRAVMLQGLVLDSKREPMVNVQLWSSGRDYQGKCPDVTGEDGRFKAMIAQFDSEVDVEVQYRTPSTSDDVVEVFFPKDKRPSSKHEKYKLLSQIPGPYKKQPDLENGQPVWLKKRTFSGLEAKICWDGKRRRWLNLVGEEMAFMLPAEDDPDLPFSDGWIASPGVDSFAPSYARSYDIRSVSFGPFKTGEPGKFVDLGELTTDA